MKRRVEWIKRMLSVGVSACLVCTTMPVITSAATQFNVATPSEAVMAASGSLEQYAKATTSYCEPKRNQSVEAVNDGLSPYASNCSYGGLLKYCSWGNTSSSEWVAYTWDTAQTLDYCQLYFYNDGWQVETPKSYQFEYKNSDGVWMPVSNAEGYGLALDRFNTTTFDPVTTKELRVVMQKNDKNNHGVGIAEWRARSSEADKTSVVSAKHVRLIEENYIEILWPEKMEDTAKDPANYEVKINGKVAELDPKLCFNYNNVTSLTPVEKVADPENAEIELTVKGDMQAVESSTKAEKKSYTFGFEPYFTKHMISKKGIHIKAGDTVAETTLQRAADIVDFMLSKPGIGDQVAKKLVESNAEVGIYRGGLSDFYGVFENAFYLPSDRKLTSTAYEPPGGWGGNTAIPTTAIASDCITNLSDSTLTHEFGHAFKLLGLTMLEDDSIMRQLDDAFANAKLRGYFYGDYAVTTPEEFFACTTTIWFGQSGYSYQLENGKWVSVDCREDLKTYDPKTYAVFEQIYPAEHFPSDLHTPSGAVAGDVEPAVGELPADPVDPDDAGLAAEEYDLDTHYFKFLSYLGTNVVAYGMDGNEVFNATWDSSASWVGYTFDEMSWKFEKVGDYYRIINKKFNMAIMPEGGGTSVGTPVTVAAVDENDETQLWQLVRTKGYFCQVVNKVSGLVIATQHDVLPGDGTLMELAPYTNHPTLAKQWRIIRLKDKPSGSASSNLTDDKYCIRPTRMNYSALQNAVDTAKAIDVSGYSESSVQTLAAVLAKADAALTNGLAPQDKIDALVSEIESAVDQLEIPAEPSGPNVETPSDPSSEAGIATPADPSSKQNSGVPSAATGESVPLAAAAALTVCAAVAAAAIRRRKQ